ncbi:hypothetical protein D3C77_432840 [compost metagenome]
MPIPAPTSGAPNGVVDRNTPATIMAAPTMVCRIPPRLLPAITGTIRTSILPDLPKSSSPIFLPFLKIAKRIPRESSLFISASKPGSVARSAENTSLTLPLSSARRCTRPKRLTRGPDNLMLAIPELPKAVSIISPAKKKPPGGGLFNCN